MKPETAWAAGFFDGEGCTRLNVIQRPNREYATVTIMITQAGSPETLERFRNAVGEGRVTGPYRASTKFVAKPYWLYRTDGRRAWDVLRKLAPLLSSPKYEQALSTLVRAKPYVNRPRLKKGPPRLKFCKRGHDMAKTRYIDPKTGMSHGCLKCRTSLKQERAARLAA